MKNPLMMSVMAAAIAVPAFAADTPVKSVGVFMDAAAFDNAQAADFWAELDGDLEEAIIERVAYKTDAPGVEIEVDINEFEMASSFAAAQGVDSVLRAMVDIQDMDDPTVHYSHDLTVTLPKAGMVIDGEEGTEVLMVPTELAYNSMIDALADAVVARIR